MHPSEQPADANGNFDGRVGLGLDSAPPPSSARDHSIRTFPVVYTTTRAATDGIIKRFVEPSKFIPKPFTDKQLVSAAAELVDALDLFCR